MKRAKTVQTPNLDKLVAVKEEATIIQNFIDWYCDTDHADISLEANGEYTDERDRERLMAEYFGIDLKEAEKERQALLTDIRQDYKVQDAIKKKVTT